MLGGPWSYQQHLASLHLTTKFILFLLKFTRYGGMFEFGWIGKTNILFLKIKTIA